MDDTPKDWCRPHGLRRPDLAEIKPSTTNTVHARLIAALLENDAPMTLEAVAERFAAVGQGPKEKALKSLRRCRPARAPVYRDGDLYALDPHCDELSMIGFMLGLRPPKVTRPPPPEVEEAPIPDPSVPLTSAELDEAWRDERLYSWSARRIVLAILEADGHPQEPAEVVEAITRRTTQHRVNLHPPQLCLKGSPVAALSDGRWTLGPQAAAALPGMRKAVRKRLAIQRRTRRWRSSPEEIEASQLAWRRRQWAAARRLNQLKRVIVRAVPADRPLGVAIIDLQTHEIETFAPDAFPALVERLSTFDLIAGEQIRSTLRALNMQPGERRLCDMSAPQKTMRVDRRTLKITTAKLIHGCCGIARAFGDEKATARRLAEGKRAGLTRLAKDVEHLAIYDEYTRLHRQVRVRDGQWYHSIHAAWVPTEEPGIRELMRSALAANASLEIVRVRDAQVGERWAGVETANVYPGPDEWTHVLVDALGREVRLMDIQRARLQGGNILI